MVRKTGASKNKNVGADPRVRPPWLAQRFIGKCQGHGLGLLCCRVKRKTKDETRPHSNDDPSEEVSAVSPREIRLGDAACSMKREI